jgi:hypothetical protein
MVENVGDRGTIPSLDDCFGSRQRHMQSLGLRGRPRHVGDRVPPFNLGVVGKSPVNVKFQSGPVAHPENADGQL